ncbi:MAG: PQQ-dependent sugar dehydrogenase [Pseudomonadota bacterium]|nr:PQQ-dependent sugar dehydrogenase [Pseudomonadota bacterium]
MRLSQYIGLVCGLGFSLTLPACAEGESTTTSAAVEPHSDPDTAQHTTIAVSPSQDYPMQLRQIADGLEHPWSIAFLPDGEILVTERTGRLRRIVNQQLMTAPVSGLPNIHAVGQGGLLDLALHPDFANNRWLYFSYTDRTKDGLTTNLARAHYQQGKLTDLTVLFSAQPRSDQGQHFSGRIIFDRLGYLYLSIGDRGEMQRAQDRNDHAGSLIRLHDDGRVPDDNPLVGQPRTKPELYSWGHRNIQGMTLHPETGEIWTTEHGARGWDEINRIQRGLNYGWPLVTHGVNYNGQPISQQSERADLESPLLHWTPSIAPSGLTFYTGSDFPAWHGQLLSGALKDRLISRIHVTATDAGWQAQEQERLLQDFGQRIRDIRQAPDGTLWLLTDARNGQVLQLKPASTHDQ